ncbi:hypothetical protein BDZ89DRAFT_1042774 [Hymenopellis radicata]|nr:hypothetical protein BDZ89DRAFT_1042774 [Hymenopellis radicata]
MTGKSAIPDARIKHSWWATSPHVRALDLGRGTQGTEMWYSCSEPQLQLPVIHRHGVLHEQCIQTGAFSLDHASACDECKSAPELSKSRSSHVNPLIVRADRKGSEAEEDPQRETVMTSTGVEGDTYKPLGRVDSKSKTRLTSHVHYTSQGGAAIRVSRQ